MSDASFAPMDFDDGRGLLPDRIQAKAPRGMRDEIRRAARSAGTSYAAFIRDAVSERLRKGTQNAPIAADVERCR